MENNNLVWYKIAASISSIMGERILVEIEIANKKICIALHENKLYAFTHICPHGGASLANGFVDAKGNIVCNKHFYKFNLKNGYNTSGEGYSLKIYKIEKREDGIYIAIMNKAS